MIYVMIPRTDPFWGSDLLRKPFVLFFRQQQRQDMVEDMELVDLVELEVWAQQSKLKTCGWPNSNVAWSRVHPNDR